MEINQGYAIRRVIAFDNECGFVLGENPKAPDPYVTWQFNMRDGERNYFWGHYCDDARLAESDLKNRAEDNQRRYYVERIEQPPEQETYKYYSTDGVTADQQGNLYVTADLPDNGVLFSYLLSFGDNVEILEPANVREQMKEKLISMLQKYET